MPSASLPPINLATMLASSTCIKSGGNNFKLDFWIASHIVNKIGGANCDKETPYKSGLVTFNM